MEFESAARLHEGEVMSEHVWTWDGFRVCKRIRKAVDKEQNDKRRVFPFRAKVFDSEIDAVRAALDDKIKELHRAELSFRNADEARVRWATRWNKLRSGL